MRPRASSLQASVHSPSWRKLFLGTNVSAPLFPALAPLNLYQQLIIKSGLGELNKHEGPSVFLKNPKIPQTTWFKDLEYDHLATSMFIN